jgi:hypothetical protein
VGDRPVFALESCVLFSDVWEPYVHSSHGAGACSLPDDNASCNRLTEGAESGEVSSHEACREPQRLNDYVRLCDGLSEHAERQIGQDRDSG